MSALVWLRTDLRSSWNSAIDYAVANHDKVSAVYYVTKQQWSKYHIAGCKIALICQRLRNLQKELQARNIELLVLDGDLYEGLPKSLNELCLKNSITHVYCNAEYEWDERQRDVSVKQALKNIDVTLAMFHDTCLVKPTEIMNLKGEPYKVFTPYFKRWLEATLQQLPGIPDNEHAKQTGLESPANQNLSTAIKPSETSNNAKVMDVWPATAPEITQKLNAFIIEFAPDYPKNRDIPSVEGTSKISPYLSIGALSPAQCLFHILQEYGDEALSPDHGAYTWVKEIAWRDFYRYVMFHFPHVSRGLPFQKHYQYFKWENNQQHFDAWKAGETGYPIVDAAMIALKQTGWMHNRLRMIVASFYCKHLLLPWKWAEDYFMSQLIDGDYASNNGGWQWSASVGTDAAPYFRIFNPTTQSERFDPKGEFIKTWLPALEHLSPKQIHEPSKHCDVQRLGYTLPIVEHKASVARTKERFKGFLAAR
ncbi:Deoxyribodipyrimidine photo-lyase [Paraglaciecola mesophila]|uniref:Deoxyribodipyrimidine photo-lyase n=1 Tax=Paraglaciecola mesophila TaxID=197222 RepID=A0A857JGT1_9ALTE|nr:FAD-binding domain-containing protein [Paraglaciecola mesophila]QHJ10181.1 Deoxyribodipyrimidine photo-lyase [Paraglaciecola mesophila]